MVVHKQSRLSICRRNLQWVATVRVSKHYSIGVLEKLKVIVSAMVFAIFLQTPIVDG